MSEQPREPSIAAGLANLHALANELRETQPLKPEVQRALAELLDELSKAIDNSPGPSDEWELLAKETESLLEALHQHQSPDLVASAHRRLEKILVDAESRAPLLVGMVQRFLDALAGSGI